MILVDSDTDSDTGTQRTALRRGLGGGIGTETLCIIAIIVRGNLTLSVQITQLPAWCRRATEAVNLKRLSESGWNSEQTDQLTTLELPRGFILQAFNITVTGPRIHFERLRFLLK